MAFIINDPDDHDEVPDCCWIGLGLFFGSIAAAGAAAACMAVRDRVRKIRRERLAARAGAPALPERSPSPGSTASEASAVQPPETSAELTADAHHTSDVSDSDLIESPPPAYTSVVSDHCKSPIVLTGEP